MLTVLLVLGILVEPSVRSYAQTRSRGECVLIGPKRSDRVGKAAARPDSKPDVVFSLTLRPTASEREITDLEIRATSGPPGIWKAGRGVPGVGYIGVARATRPSDIINRDGAKLSINPHMDKNLLLFVTDDGKFSRKDRAYHVKALHSDGTSWTIPVQIGSVQAAVAPPTVSGTYPVRMSAFVKGMSRYDAVSSDEKITGDDKADGRFVLTVQADQREITAIEIRSVGGRVSRWDTVPGSGNPAIGVSLVSDPTRLLNNRDGTVNVRIKGRLDLNLFVADNGSISKGETDFRVTLTFADGGVSWCRVQKSDITGSVADRPTDRSGPRVNFLGTWLGYVSTDAVGKYSGVKPDSEADAVFGLDIEVTPKTEMKGIEISNLSGTGTRWATGKVTTGAWGLGVAHQSGPVTLLNKPDGSVTIPVGKRAQFYLYAADPGGLSRSVNRLRIVIHLADGSSYQQALRRPLASTSTVAPGTGDPQRAMGLITCEFRGFIADLANTSTRPGKDGYLDGTFILKLKVDKKQMAKVDVKDATGAIRWSSLGRAPAMFLGVAMYPKIYDLANPKGGMVKIPVSGRRTFYLYAADNGLLSDPNSRLTATVTFTDKTTLSTDVIK